MRFPMWLITLSVWVSEAPGGPRGYSMCARFWEGRLNGNPVSTLLVSITDRLFWFDPGHCRKAWLLRK
nr:MAG TPA: hypothetical protein [Caudoviricetes sp.]